MSQNTAEKTKSDLTQSKEDVFMKRLLSLLMTVLTMNFFMPLTASAEMQELDYVSLGDSLAAGQPWFGCRK